MKRLLRISLDTLVSSLMLIFIWVILSFTVDKNLINIFTLTFPIQYISAILRAIFATGANISKEKGNKDDVMSGIIIGILVSIIVFLFLIVNVDGYLSFMKYQINKIFVIYSFMLIFIQTILGFLLTKLYYEGKNELANKYSISFCMLNFVLILITSLAFESEILIVAPVMVILVIYVVFILIKHCERFNLNFNLYKWIKYNSVELSDHIMLGIAYLFGISNTVSYGSEYMLAFTFTSLITDTQWDVSEAINTVAKIDISKRDFNYKEHLKNAYKLIAILLISVVLMFFLLFRFYDLNLGITILFLLFHFIDFSICPLYKISTYYLQLEYSTFKATGVNVFTRFLRFTLSFLKTPFCTVIAQTSSSILQVFFIQFMLKKNFKVDEDGYIEVRTMARKDN